MMETEQNNWSLTRSVLFLKLLVSTTRKKKMFKEQKNNASGFKSYQKKLSRTSRENTTTMHSSLFYHALLGLELKQGVIIDWWSRTAAGAQLLAYLSSLMHPRSLLSPPNKKFSFLPGAGLPWEAARLCGTRQPRQHQTATTTATRRWKKPQGKKQKKKKKKEETTTNKPQQTVLTVTRNT